MENWKSGRYIYKYIMNEWNFGEINIEFEINEKGEVLYEKPEYTFI